MKKGYEKPVVEIVDFKLNDAIMDDSSIDKPVISNVTEGVEDW